MKPQEEAKKLYEQVVKAQRAFEDIEFRNNIKESEVSFRYDAIRGSLIMARNDIWGMFQEWQSELLAEKKSK